MKPVPVFILKEKGIVRGNFHGRCFFIPFFGRGMRFRREDFDALFDPCWSYKGFVIRGTIKGKWILFHFLSSGNMFRRRIT